MRRRHQFSIGALMTLVLATGVLLAHLRDPNSRAALTALAISSLLFVASWSVIYACTACISWAIRLFHWLTCRERGPKRASPLNGPSSLIRS
jgi:glycerol uptake facilitator-like aquaporin